MALSYTSVRVDASGSDSGSTSVTVPSGCTCVAALWGANSDTGHITSLTLNSVSLTLDVNVDASGNQEYGVGYLDDPDTGSQTFAWNWGSRGGWCDDGQIYLIFAESSTGLARFLDAAGSSVVGNGTPSSLSLTSTADSMCVALLSDANGTPDLSNGGNQTVTTNNEVANGFGHDVAYRNSPGDPSTTMAASYCYYPNFTAVSFEEVAGGGVTYTLTAGSGSYSLTGTAASLTASRLLTAASGSYSLSGTSAGLNRSYTLTANTGSYSLSGTDISLSVSRLLSADSGAFVLTGTAAALLASRSISVESGSYTLNGTSISLALSRALTAASGTYSLSGTDAVLTVSRVLTAVSGSYALTGTDVTLTYTPAGSYTLTAESGSYALSGSDVALTASRVVTAQSGSYALSGTDVHLNFQRLLTAASGSYSLTGTDIGFSRNYVLSAESGSYALTGSSAGLTYTSLGGIASIFIYSYENKIESFAFSDQISFNSNASPITVN